MNRPGLNVRGGAVAAALLATVLVSCAERTPAGTDIEVADAWVRAVRVTGDGQVNTAAYMRIRNTTGTADRLVGVSSPAASRVELHRTTIGDDGLAMMGLAGPQELQPGQELVLEPGGLHVMLMGVKETLEEGAVVQVTLAFEVAGEVSLEVEVRSY